MGHWLMQVMNRGLFIGSILLFIGTCFGTRIYMQYMKKVRKSIHTYFDPRVYATEAEVGFFYTIWQQYNKYKEQGVECVNTQALIEKNFAQEKVGGINIEVLEDWIINANWRLLLLTIMMGFWHIMFANKSQQDLIWMISTFLLSGVLAFIKTYTNVSMQRFHFYKELEECLDNKYQQENKQKNEEQIAPYNEIIDALADIQSRIIQLERKLICMNVQDKPIIEPEWELQEEDIAYMLEALDHECKQVG